MKDMKIKYYRYDYIKDEKLWYPTPFSVEVVTRILKWLNLPIGVEKFQETEERIMQILEEEYKKADSKTLDVPEICLSLNGNEFNEEEWKVEIDFCKIRILHNWNHWNRNGRMPITDEIEIRLMNQEIIEINWKLEKLENKLMGKKVPYLVKLISYFDDNNENRMLKFLEKNRNICDFERAKSYDIRQDCPVCTHKFVTENLPVILNYYRTEVLQYIRELQATQVRDSKVINLFNKSDSVLLEYSIYDKRVDIYTTVRNFIYFGAERIEE